MRKNTTILTAAFLIAVIILAGCMHQPALKQLTLNLPAQANTYNNDKFLSVVQSGGNNTPSDNSMTNAGATLGRVLFYDPRLSVNNTVSCASCHKQQYGFADNLPLSVGFQGQNTKRNTPAIINAANKSVFFWDGRVNSLETQTLLPVQNHIEMGMESASFLPEKLNAISYYPGLFNAAFGNSEITSAKVSMALSQFVRSIVSTSSNTSMSADAQAGQVLFQVKYQCSKCHTGANMGGAPLPSCGGYVTGNPSRSSVPNTSNIGLDVAYTDGGVQALNGDPAQNGYFIIPSLRNVGLTAPYMHDGRYATLSDVIDHYSNTIQPHPNLDPILLSQNFAAHEVISNTGTPVKMNISATEKTQLIAFLNSLTDYSITTDPRFSNPFNN
jgi:cytochrome c peroxidase